MATRVDPTHRLGWLAVAFAGSVALVTGCTSELDRNAIAGRPCPCLPGWVCEDSPGTIGVCVERSLGAGGSLGVTSANVDAGSHAGATASPPRDAGTPGAGGATPETPGPPPDAGGPIGAGQCSAAAAPTGVACPAVCDDCAGGTCHIRCDDTRDCAGTSQAPLGIACPAGFHCEVSCSSDDNCNAVVVSCSGGQACDVLCDGKKSCKSLSLECAGGPCSLRCGSEAQVCRDSELRCGTGACLSTCEGAESPAVVGCESSCSAACGC